MKKLTLLYFFITFLVFWSAQIFAQISINTLVMPPYQSRIAEYASNPHLMLISITNTSTTIQEIQLTANITGDNGISAWVKKGYRSPSAIRVGIGETITLNGNDIAFLFDINKIEYTGISRADMTRGLGLLEGNYTLCIQALNYRSLEPISMEQSGCATFRISDLEPPRILSPFNSQKVSTKGVQVVPIVWSTPAGSSPNTQYKVKIVEMIASRNPNDAIQTTRPLVDEVVQGNTLVYGPQYPALVKGRSYAMVVQANDPTLKSKFRNNGLSEVTTFVYGNEEEGITEGSGGEQQGKKENVQLTRKYATNVIKGKLVWSFKKSEEIISGRLNWNSQSLETTPIAGASISNDIKVNNTLSTYYLGHNALQSNNATANAKVDPTLNMRAFLPASQGIIKGTVDGNNIVSSINTVVAQPNASTVINSTGASSLAYAYHSVSAEAGSEKYPLSNIKFTIRGVKNETGGLGIISSLGINKNKNAISLANDVAWSGMRTQQTLNIINNSAASGDVGVKVSPTNSDNLSKAQSNTSNQQNFQDTRVFQLNPNNVLATGRTDSEGNFSIQLMDPKYEGMQQYDRIVVSVENDGFETFEFNIPIEQLQKSEMIDIGEKLLLAKTYRLEPTFQMEEVSNDLPNPGMRLTVLRAKEGDQNQTYLQQEGMLQKGSLGEVVRNGKTYMIVAKDSISATSSKVSKFTFSIPRMFYTGEVIVEMESITKLYKQKTSTIRIIDQKLPSSTILLARPTFNGSLIQPAVSGQVMLSAGENLLPVSGAVLSVSFEENDRLPVEMNAFVIGNLSTALKTGEMKAVSTLTGGQSHGNISSQSIQNAGANVNFLASSTAVNGTSSPVMVATQVIGNNNQMNYQVITLEDANRSEDALKSKYGYYTVKTDSTGQYYIGNLPPLKDGASYTVKLVSVPSTFRDMEVTPNLEQSFVGTKGVTETRSFTISPEVFNIVGRVVDSNKKGIGYARAHFKGSTNYFETGQNGLFQTSYFAGKHILIVEKEGYLPIEVNLNLTTAPTVVPGLETTLDKIVHIKKLRPGEAVMNAKNGGTWIQSLQNTNTVKNELAMGATLSPAMFGVAGGGGLNVQAVQSNNFNRVGPSVVEENYDFPYQLNYNVAFTTQINNTYRFNENVFSSQETYDLGDVGPMLPRMGKILFKVISKSDGMPIPNAQIQLFDTLQITNDRGEWKYEGFGGTATIQVTPPTGSGLIPIKKSIKIEESGKVTEVLIELERGVRVYGIVRSGDTNVAEAQISVEGRDYIQVKSNASGEYELFLPAGEFELRAAKSGYFTRRESHVFQIDQAYQLDFLLDDGGGKNISTLMGFAIELDKTVPEGSSERWSGKFVNLKGIAPIFNTGIGISIPFNNIRVTFDNQGNAIPENNEVVTDVESVSLKAFGFLPVLLKGEQRIKVIQDAQGNGHIAGKLLIDVTKIQGSRGFGFPLDKPIALTLPEASGVTDIEVFKADGAYSGQQVKLKLAGFGPEELSMNLYGFSMSLNSNKSFVGTDGVELVGEIKTPAMGPITAAAIQVEQFKLSKELKIQTIRVQQTNLPSINIAGWKAQMTALLFNENGFKIGGKLTFSLPQSAASEINFSNLSLGKDALYGGDFSFPGNGISVYKIATLKSGNKPLSFGRVGNTQVYYLSGSAEMKFGKLLDKDIRIPSFQVQTDGRFMLEAPVNYEASLAFAKFKIGSITLSTLSGQAPYISVQGEFKADLPSLKFEASDIRFSANTAGDVSYSVGTIKGELSVAVMNVGVTVGIKDNGFEGGGKLAIPGFPMINAEVAFHYYKVDGGVDIGASFAAGVSIPIGIVEITKVGGGFSYNSANKKFMININGGASITGMQALVKLEPISLTVESGPIITGNVGVVIGTALELAQASVTLNIPGKFFAIKVESNIEPIKGVAKADLNGLLKIKWDPNESYIFLGANMNINVLNILKNYGEFAIGVNVKNPVNRGDEIAGYFRYLKGDVYDSSNSTFSGVYLHTTTSFGVPKEKAVGIGGEVFGVKGWFHTTSDALLLFNFAENDYRIKFGGSISVGGEGCFIGICVGGGFSACYAFAGGYQNGGWYLAGKAGGEVEIQIGKKADCNSGVWWGPIPVGGRVCIGAHASVTVSTITGIGASVGMGKNNSGNNCM